MYNAAVYMPVTTRGSSMAARYEFTRLFRELTEPLTKAQVAKRIKVTPSYVSQLRAGTYGPSRDLIERIIEAFDLDRATWLRAAGFRAPGDLHPDPEDVLIERLAPKVAAKLAYDPNRFERELLEALAEHYATRDFFFAHTIDLAELPPDTGRPAVVRRVQQTETTMRDRREAEGAKLPPPLLFVTGE
jgi:transcriptional regulator with XRE-family HTH domain